MRKKEIPYRYMFLLTLAVGALFLIFCFPTFETSDDATIIRMVDGSRGSVDPHLIYQNVILGCFYILLYKLPLNLPWYSLVQCGAVLLCMSILAWCCTRLLKGVKGLVTALILELFLGYECIVQIQYTKTAGLAACAGVMLILAAATGMRRSESRLRMESMSGRVRRALPRERQNVSEYKTERRLYTAGILLIVYASMLRFAQAAVCAALAGGAILYAFLCVRERPLPLRRTRGGSLLAALVMTLVLVMICYGADSLSYRFGRLSGFKRFDAARIELLDHGMPSYGDYSEQLQAAGLKKSAYRLLKGWTFADPEVFTAEALEKVGSLKEPVSYLSLENVKGFFREVPAGMIGRRFFYFFLLCLLIWLVCGKKNLWNVLCALYGILAFGAMYYYLYCGNRYLVNRVDVPMLLSLGMALLYLSGTQRERKAVKEEYSASGRTGKGKTIGDRIRSVIVTAAGIAVLLAVTLPSAIRPDLQLRGGERAQMFETYAGKSRNLLYQASNDSEHLYLAKLYTISDDYAFGVFETAPKNCLSNILWLGGWSYNSGCYQDIMERYGITNPMKDMIDNDKVLLVDSKIERTVKYLRAYYDDSIDAAQVGEIGSYPVYTVSSGRSG